MSVVSVPNDLPVLTVKASAPGCFPWVTLFVVARLTFVSEVIGIQTDLWVIAIDIIQPYLPVVDDLAQLHVALFTDAAINGFPVSDIRSPGSAPWSAVVELFLGHAVPRGLK